MSHVSDELWPARQLHQAGLKIREIIEFQGDAKMRRVVSSRVKAKSKEKVRGVKLYRRLHATTEGIAKLTLLGKYKLVDDYALGLRTSRTVIERAHLALVYRLQLHMMYSVD